MFIFTEGCNLMNIRIGDRSYGVKSYIKNFDKVLLGLIAVLLVFSMLCINSATYGSDAHSRSMIVQGVAIGLGFVLMIIVSKLDYDIISDLWKYIVVASSAALFLTALIAPEINGNRNWLMIGSVNIQTSEFTKICFAVTMSKHLAKLGEDLNKPKNILFVLIHFLAYLVPILLQGDIGTALIYIGIFVVLGTPAAGTVPSCTKRIFRSGTQSPSSASIWDAAAFWLPARSAKWKQSWPLWRGAISSWTTGCLYTPGGALVRTAGRATPFNDVVVRPGPVRQAIDSAFTVRCQCHRLECKNIFIV